MVVVAMRMVRAAENKSKLSQTFVSTWYLYLYIKASFWHVLTLYIVSLNFQFVYKTIYYLVHVESLFPFSIFLLKQNQTLKYETEAELLWFILALLAHNTHRHRHIHTDINNKIYHPLGFYLVEVSKVSPRIICLVF